MNTIPSLIHDLLDAVWRRRTLFALPLLLIAPFGIYYAKFGPKTYEAKTLLLLQESSREYPLPRDLPGGTRIRDQLPSLEALLKSDRVLSGVMTDIAGAEAPTEPLQIARWIRDFSSSISLDVVGNDFLELSLTGSSPVGLGGRLEVVTSRFLEALMVTQDAISASEVVLSQRKRELETAEDALARFKQDYAGQLSSDVDDTIAQLPILKQRLAEKEREVSAIGAKIDSLHAGDIPAAQSGSANAANAVSQPETTPTAGEAAQLESRFKELQTEVDRLARSVETSERMAGEAVPLQRRLHVLEARKEAARSSYQAYSKRYGSIALNGRGPGILNAPERIQLIDPPSDPTFPKNSSLKLALIAIFGAMILASALVAGAELLDTRVRRASQLASLTGVPVLARLPQSSEAMVSMIAGAAPPKGTGLGGNVGLAQ